MVKLAENAQYFEKHAPVAAAIQEAGCRKPPVAKAVETVTETGDFHVSTVGDNLPNENEIREKYGSKSFLFTGSSRTCDARRRLRAHSRKSGNHPKRSPSARSMGKRRAT